MVDCLLEKSITFKGNLRIIERLSHVHILSNIEVIPRNKKTVIILIVIRIVRYEKTKNIKDYAVYKILLEVDDKAVRD